MERLEQIREELARIRAFLEKADQDLLAGVMKLELYDRVTTTKLELLKCLLQEEQSASEQRRHQDLQAELDTFVERSSGLARLQWGNCSGYCPRCHSSSRGCRQNAYIDIDHRIVVYGIECLGDNITMAGFHRQGDRPIPQHLLEFLGNPYPKP